MQLCRIILLVAVFVLVTPETDAPATPQPWPVQPTAALNRPAPDHSVLLKTVILMRHGVRAPTQTSETLREWSGRPWPAWPVARGELTTRGAELVRLLWKTEGERLRAQGLLPSGRLSKADVLVLADLDQRTRATAQALLQGLAPSQDLPVHVNNTPAPDPLFHPVKARLCAFNAAAIAAEITPERIHALAEDLAPQLDDLGSILGPAAPDWCARYRLTTPCHVTSTPSRLLFTQDRHNVNLDGGLSAASSAAELFLLEYGQWNQNAAWGNLDATQLSLLLRVHTDTFNLINRTPSVAAARGSALLDAMLKSLAGSHPDPAFNTAKLVVFVVHDTNLANIGSLLDLHWQLPGYPADDIPPASLLALSLWQTPQGLQVSADYATQSLATLHNPAQATPPLRQTLSWTPDIHQPQILLPLNDLFHRAEPHLRHDCIPHQPNMTR